MNTGKRFSITTAIGIAKIAVVLIGFGAWIFGKVTLPEALAGIVAIQPILSGIGFIKAQDATAAADVPREGGTIES